MNKILSFFAGSAAAVLVFLIHFFGGNMIPRPMSFGVTTVVAGICFATTATIVEGILEIR